MGRKSRDKKEKQLKEQEEEKRNPMYRDMRLFLKKRNIRMEKASTLLYVISVMVSFMMHNVIRKFLKLPGISPEEDKADEDRMMMLGQILEYEAGQLGLNVEEIIQELIYPVTAKRELVDPIVNQIFDQLDAVAVSDSFRETTEHQIQNPEFWEDTLEGFEQREEDYFQALKELFIQMIGIIRSSLREEDRDRNFDEEIENIRTTYNISPPDFIKLRRRATEFFKIAFASFLRIEFQPLREQVDQQLSPQATA